MHFGLNAKKDRKTWIHIQIFIFVFIDRKGELNDAELVASICSIQNKVREGVKDGSKYIFYLKEKEIKN